MGFMQVCQVGQDSEAPSPSPLPDSPQCNKNPLHKEVHRIGEGGAVGTRLNKREIKLWMIYLDPSSRHGWV